MEQWLEGVVTSKRRWNHRLYSLCFEAPLVGFKAGQFTRLALDGDAGRVARPYSLVNPPHQSPLEVYFNEVPEGPLSPRLADLEPGDRLWVAARPGGHFVLDEIPEAEDLWMLATGTALGPYLSILGTDEAWRRFQRIVLVHGVRTGDELTYGEQIQRFLTHPAGRFQFIPVLSREHRADSLHGRIPETLADGRLERAAGLAIAPERSHLMLCGNQDMLRDTSALLEARQLHRHRRREPGHYSLEKYH